MSTDAALLDAASSAKIPKPETLPDDPRLLKTMIIENISVKNLLSS